MVPYRLRVADAPRREGIAPPDSEPIQLPCISNRAKTQSHGVGPIVNDIQHLPQVDGLTRLSQLVAK
jgi:hypothetical protein